MAKENWSSEVRAAVPPPPFRPDLVEKIYAAELGGGPTAQRLKRVMLLEISQYLENYLWPHFDADTATDAHVMSILVRGMLRALGALQRTRPAPPRAVVYKSCLSHTACAGYGEREVPRGRAGLGRLSVAAGRAAEPVRAHIRAACARRWAWRACLVHARARDVPAVCDPCVPKPGERGRAQAGSAAGVAAAVARAVAWPPAGAAAHLALAPRLANTEAEGDLCGAPPKWLSAGRQCSGIRALRCTCAAHAGRVLVQLELQTHEVLVKHWRSLAKKEARAAKEAGNAHVPVVERPEAAFVPSLLDEFLGVRSGRLAWPLRENIVLASMAGEQA